MFRRSEDGTFTVVEKPAGRHEVRQPAIPILRPWDEMVDLPAIADRLMTEETGITLDPEQMPPDLGH